MISTYNLHTLSKGYTIKIFSQYEMQEGHDLNKKLTKLFEKFDDHTSFNETLIKVAALNKIYSIGILNIKPVANMPVKHLGGIDFSQYSKDDFVGLVDRIRQTNYATDDQPKSGTTYPSLPNMSTF